MADVSVENIETQIVDEENNEVEEPEKKKPKLENSGKKKGYNLEDRLNGILCCAVCLDLPNVAVYQVCISCSKFCNELPVDLDSGSVYLF